MRTPKNLTASNLTHRNQYYQPPWRVLTDTQTHLGWLPRHNINTNIAPNGDKRGSRRAGEFFYSFFTTVLSFISD